MVHNGNVPNVNDHDTLFLLNQLNPQQFEESLIQLVKTIPTAYSLLILFNNTLYVVRDRYGIRPLFTKQSKESVYVSSETCIWNSLENVSEVPSGTILKIQENNLKTLYQYPECKDALCALEVLYLMHEDSMYNGQFIKDIRFNLGKELAINDTFDDSYTVVGIPHSGLSYAKGYAYALQIPYKKHITLATKERTFITKEHYRKNVSHKKFIIHPDIKNEKVIIIDDTIVRGTVIQQIIKQLHEAGVKEIHIRVPSPPIVDINRYGIAIHNKASLLMNKTNQHEVHTYLNVDSVKFLDIGNLYKYISKESYMEFFGINFD